MSSYKVPLFLSDCNEILCNKMNSIINMAAQTLRLYSKHGNRVRLTVQAFNIVRLYQLLFSNRTPVYAA